MYTRYKTSTAQRELHSARKKRLFELDALRALAIIFIVVHHLIDYAYTYLSLPEVFYYVDFQIFPFFFFGLALFFFVSGYALYYNNKTFSTKHAVRGFLKRRAIRIYPLYWVAVAVFIVLGIGEWGDNIAWIIAQICGAQGLLAPRFGTPVITLWFIGVILLFYLIYPLVVSISNMSKRLALVFALSMPLLLFVVLRLAFNIVDFRFFVYYALFFGGLVASKYDVLYRYSEKLSYFKISVLLLFFALALIASVSLFDAQLQEFFYIGLNTSASSLTTSTVLGITLADLLGLLFIYVAFTLSRLIRPSISRTARKAISGIAFSSYCVYLFHRPVFELLINALDATQLVSLQKVVLLFACGIPLTFVVGYALQRGWDNLLAKVVRRMQLHQRRRAHTR
jgi:peptidoglycan/LPS O-acetylase OafA/YrhL